MRKKGHIIFAFILNALFIYLLIYLGFGIFQLTWKNIAIMSLLIAFYSILPDIDHKSSYVTWMFMGLGIIGLLVGVVEFILEIDKPNPIVVLVMACVLLGFTFISSNFLRHRGFVHTVQAGLIAVLPLYFIFHNFFYPALAYVAWHSHLLGDGFFFKTRS